MDRLPLHLLPPLTLPLTHSLLPHNFDSSKFLEGFFIHWFLFTLWWKQHCWMLNNVEVELYNFDFLRNFFLPKQDVF